MENFISEILETNPNIKLSIKNWLKTITTQGYLVFDGEVIGDTIWSLPKLINIFEHNPANQEVLKVISDLILVSEKAYPTLGKALVYAITDKGIQIADKKSRLSFKQIIKQIKLDNRDEIIESVLNTIVKNGNPSLSLSINRLPIEKPTIRFSALPSVRLKVTEGFIVRDSLHKNCKFFMVDGAVSSTSEITKLLNHSFENKDETIFLVCRSFTEDIIFTLKENYDRNLTNIIPIQYGFDLESINSLPDLSSLVGGDPLTPHKGDLIIAADLLRMGTSDFCKINNKTMTVRPSKTYQYHLKNLSKKIQDNSEETAKIFSRRLALLSSNSCRIELPRKSKFDNIEVRLKHSAMIMGALATNKSILCTTNNEEFYITELAATMLNETLEKINDILKVEIVLKRSKHGQK